MDLPDFKPDVPGPLLEGASSRDKWMYEQLSIQHKQNNWIIQQLSKGQDRFDSSDLARREMRNELALISDRLLVVERLKDRLSAKWAVLVAVFSPVILGVLGGYIKAWIEKHTK